MQAESARVQADQAKRQVEEAVRANAIAAEQLAILMKDREDARRIGFRFQPHRKDHQDVLLLVNDAPFDTYVRHVQLSGPDVNPRYNGILLDSASRVGGEDFFAARGVLPILDVDGPRGEMGGGTVMAYDSTAQLVLTLKTEGRLYEVRTEVTLSSERGFSTLNTTMKELDH